MIITDIYQIIKNTPHLNKTYIYVYDILYLYHYMYLHLFHSKQL